MKRSKNPVLLGTFPAVKLPSRSRPGEFFDEFEQAVKHIPLGHVVEIDSARITEHRARRYLGILATKDPEYRRFIVRTTGGDARRRVFIEAVDSETTSAQLEVKVDPAKNGVST